MNRLYYSLGNRGTTATRCRGNCVLEIWRNWLTSTGPSKFYRSVFASDPVWAESPAPELTYSVIRRMVVAAVDAARFVATRLFLRGGLLWRFGLRFGLAAR